MPVKGTKLVGPILSLGSMTNRWWSPHLFSVIVPPVLLQLTEYESFEELIRRSYGTSFLHMPDEEPLSYQALLLLLKLSYKVKFLGCEDECSQELLNHITAQTCGEIVGVVEAWDEPCPSTAHLLQVAMDKLISALSPLESLWQQGKFCLGNSEDAILPSNAPLSTPAKVR